MKTSLITMLVLSALYSQNIEERLQYFPLQIGNVWEYHIDGSDGFEQFYYSRVTYIVIDDSTFTGDRHCYKVDEIRHYEDFGWGEPAISTSFLCVDTTNATVYTPDSCEYYDLSLDLNDTILAGCGSQPHYIEEQGSNTLDTLNGYSGDYIVYDIYDSNNTRAFYYGLGIGYEYIRYSYFVIGQGTVFSYSEKNITGAIINGIQYGQILGNILEYTPIPDQIMLYPNYPNPFNPVTTIQYELPQRSDVQITIYDLLGRKVTMLLSETQDAGFKSVIWNATNDKGKPVSAGVYLYQIEAGGYMQTKKMVLLK